MILARRRTRRGRPAEIEAIAARRARRYMR